MNNLPILLSLTLLFLSTELLQAQRVYKTRYKHQADVRVFFVKSKARANCLIYKTRSKSQAKRKSSLWYFVKKKHEADLKIYVVQRKYQARLKVFYVNAKHKARCSF